jgi:hypothetical protein
MEYLHQMEDLWYDFFSHCLDVASSNFEILLKSPNQLMTLPEPILDEIIERALTSKLHKT